MPEQDKKRVLVTGASGFIGGKVCAYLAERGYQVTGLAGPRFAAAGFLKQPGTYKLVACDLTDREAVNRLLNSQIFEYVINCAGLIDHRSWSETGETVYNSHFNGLINCLQALDRTKLRRFVQIGSSDQYGTAKAPQNEALREAPFTPYSFAKTAADHFLGMLFESEKLPFTSLRLFLAYGPGQNSERLLPFIIRSCLEDREVPLSPGLQVRDFCFIDDICEMIRKSLYQEAAIGQILNCGSGQGIKVQDIALKIQEKIGKGRLDFNARSVRAGENPALVADMSKTTRALDFIPQYSLNRGLEITIAHYRALLQH